MNAGQPASTVTRNQEVIVTCSRLHMTGIATEVRNPRTRAIEGYDIKYVPTLGKEPGGQVVPPKIVQDIVNQASRTDTDKPVFFALFADVNSDGSKGQIHFQVADLYGKWIARDRPWSDAMFIGGSELARSTISEFLERDFGYNERMLAQAYWSMPLEEFHRMTKVENDRVMEAARHLDGLQARDLLRDTPLRKSTLAKKRSRLVTVMSPLSSLDIAKRLEPDSVPEMVVETVETVEKQLAEKLAAINEVEIGGGEVSLEAITEYESLLNKRTELLQHA